MFKLSQSPTFWAAVEVEITAEKGGRTVAKFDLQYKRLTQDEAVALGERLGTETTDARMIARELVTGWRGVADENDVAVEFSEAAFERLLDLGFARPIIDAFTHNLPKAKQKN
jgi:hypothetical protein